MAKEIKLGYEMPSGNAVVIPLRHTAVTGQTQESGKTTTLEALITRSGLRAVAFITKRGESGFRLQVPIRPYFREPKLAPETPMWRWVESIFESIGENVGKEEKSAIIQCSEETLEHESYKVKGETKRRLVHSGETVTTLAQVAENVALMKQGARGKMQTALTLLDAYFNIVLPQIAKLKASRELELQPGVNVMDLVGLSTEMQMLIIRSVLEEIYLHRTKTVVIIPECAKILPRMRATPVRFAADLFIREGLVLGNVLMLDSQDLANVATEILKSIGVWILGKQTEINEVKRVVDYIPGSPKVQPQQIQQLGRGEFWVVYSDQVRKVYVQPAGMDDVHAQAIARGEERSDSWTAIVRSLPVTEAKVEMVAESEAQNPPGGAVTTLYTEPSDPKDRSELIARLSEELAALRQEWDARVDEVERLREENTLLLAKLEEAQNAKTKSQQDVEAAGASNGGGIGDSCSLNARPGVDADTVHPIRADAPRGAGKLSSAIASVHALENGEFSRFLAWLRQTPEAIALIAAQPRIEVTIDRPTLEMDGSSTKGRLARLLAEKFFANARAIEEMIAEFRRRGWMAATGRPVPLNLVLKDLCELGFLTMESTGYQAVPEMQVRIREAK